MLLRDVRIPEKNRRTPTWARGEHLNMWDSIQSSGLNQVPWGSDVATLPTVPPCFSLKGAYKAMRETHLYIKSTHLNWDYELMCRVRSTLCDYGNMETNNVEPWVRSLVVFHCRGITKRHSVAHHWWSIDPDSICMTFTRLPYILASPCWLMNSHQQHD